MDKGFFSKNSSKGGAIYSDSDYVGFWMRFLVVLIDGIVLIFLGIILLFIFTLFSLPDKYLLLIILFIVLIYLTIIKSSSFGTIAYFVLHIKIVELNGNSPSFLKMIIRLVFLLFGPLTFILDMIWLTSESTKQTLRDKIAGTYVLKRNASPIEFGIIKYMQLYVLGYIFTVREVQKLET
jgi:uncharacterized RDD family membrane protein YckC